MAPSSEVIERIKKLLALSSDESTTENERTLALNRAKDLMARHCVSEHQLKDSEKIKSLIETRIYTPKLDNPLPAYLHNPMLMNSLIQPIANNFGCYVAFRITTGEHFLMGFKENLEITMYACDVLLNQGIKDARVGFAKTRSIGFTMTFWNGFIEGLHQRFTKLSDETAIALYDKVKSKFDEIVQSVPITLPSSSEESGHRAGMNSAKNATLNPGVTSAKGNLLR